MPSVTAFSPCSVSDFRALYESGVTPADVVRDIYSRIQARGHDSVWIYLPPLEELLDHLPTDRSLPLFGIPFAIKDNIDVGGWPTTAACPEFAFTPRKDATVVARLRAAGAIPIGKTNMDQFATGLVGTRSPYGIPRCIFNERYVSGGSSSGSGVAVASGMVAFSLGTDTAGSGRVPAAFNNIVGIKPSRGLLSCNGVVPACRSLDCVTVFAASVADAEEILSVAEGFDMEDPYSRRRSPAPVPHDNPLRIGIPPKSQLEFLGDAEAAKLFGTVVARISDLGFQCVEIDFAPFRDAAKLLYAGPWVAERLAALERFVDEKPNAVHPVVREIIAGSAKYTAVDAYKAQYALERLKKLAAIQWAKMDLLLLPTTPTIYTVAEVLSDPIRLNSNLGIYTNFVNLMDLCGIAIPAGFRPTNGLPFGVTVLGPAFSESAVCGIARKLTGEPPRVEKAPDLVRLAVVGAHLSGQPLNAQLTDRDATLLQTCRTTSDYRLYALANTAPAKPGLVRDATASGPGIELEVWQLTREAFGDFVAKVPAPMVIGNVTLANGSECKSFLCEPYALEGATEITSYGGWRAWLQSRQQN